MRAAADTLLPILSSEGPSKAPFYIAGAVLAAWAVLLGVAGIRLPDFPGSPAASRALMGISVLLVAATLGTAVGTATKHHAEAHAEGGGPAEPAGAAPAQGQTPSGTGGGKVEISADPSGRLKFEQTSVTAAPGKVTIEFDNPSPVPHDVTVARGTEKVGGTKVVTGGKATAQVDLQPGAYTFYCSVDGHRPAGMQGKLSVQAS